jgi:acyl dehydratase
MRLPAEEMPVGVEIDCGTHPVTEEEIVEFASAWDPQYFHVDREAALHSDFGGLIASGVHTTAIFQRLAATTVYSRYDVIAGREIEKLRFRRPVRAGDVLTGTVLVRSVEQDGRGRCLVRIVGTLRNQHGASVLELEVDSLVRSRRR